MKAEKIKENYGYKKTTRQPTYPGKRPEIDPDKVPENPNIPDEDPDIIPDEDNPFEITPDENPSPGEKP